MFSLNTTIIAQGSQLHVSAEVSRDNPADYENRKEKFAAACLTPYYTVHIALRYVYYTYIITNFRSDISKPTQLFIFPFCSRNQHDDGHIFLRETCS